MRGLAAWLSPPLAMLAVVAATLFATAQDAPWEVVEVAGEVQMRPAGGAPRAAVIGDTVGPGDAMETGADGRARLTRAADAMTLSPNSQMMIPVAGPDAPSVLQRLGTLLFEIDSRFGTDRFRVETPYLAAVIKGTVFTVTVGPQGGALSVIEGLVEVRRPGAPQPVLVQPGATVRAPAGQGGQLDLIEPNGGGNNPPPTEPGGDDQGSREDDRGNGVEKAEARDKGWKAGFDPGTGDIAERSDGFLNNGRGRGRGVDGATGPGNRGPKDGSGVKEGGPPSHVTLPAQAGGNPHVRGPGGGGPSNANKPSHAGGPGSGGPSNDNKPSHAGGPGGGGSGGGGPPSCPGNSCGNRNDP